MSMTAAGATALAAGISAASALGATGLTYAANQGMSSRARRENYQYNEKAANNALNRWYSQQDYLNALQRRQYMDLESPQAMIRMLKEAGLSPSIYAGGVGGGVSGITTAGGAPQGGGAGGISAPQLNMQPIQMAESMQAVANAELAHEQANTLRGDNERGKNEIAKGFAELQEILAECGLKNANTELAKAQTTAVELDNLLKSNTIDFDIRRAEYLADKLLWEERSAFYKANTDKVNAEVAQETKEDNIKKIRLANAELAVQIDAKKSEIKLTKQQISQISNDIALAWEQYEIDLRRIKNDEKSNELRQKELDFAKEKLRKEIKAIYDRQELDHQEWAYKYGTRTEEITEWGTKGGITKQKTAVVPTKLE